MLQCVCAYKSYNFAPSHQNFKPFKALLSDSCFPHYSVSIVLLERNKHPVLSGTTLFCFEVFHNLYLLSERKEKSDFKNLIHILMPLIALVFLCAYKHLLKTGD